MEQATAPEVPEVVVLRLPLYVRALSQLMSEGADVVSSQQLGPEWCAWSMDA